MPDFPRNEQDIKAFRALLGEARFSRYLAAANDDEGRALSIYQWNAEAAQAFYLPIQIWEICLRNQMNRFLCWKYNGSWPYDDRRAVRQLQGQDRTKLLEVRQRQERERQVPQATTDSIAADLTAGFWVSLLANRYANHLSWRYNLTRVFPNAPADWRLQPSGWSATKPYSFCGDVLSLHNRIAHHEPIFAMDLSGLHFKLGVLVAAMSNAAFSYLSSHCTVQEILSRNSRQ